MGISVNTSKQQVTASVNDETVSATVSAGFGSSGAAGQAATIAVGTVTTGAPGSSAAVVNSGSSSAAVFDFTIPAGATGATGPAGSTNPSDIVTATTYATFLPSGGSLATAYSGIDSAIGAKANAADFDQGVKTTDSPTFDDLTLGGTLTMYGGDIKIGVNAGDPTVAFGIGGFGRAIDIEDGGRFFGSWSLNPGASFYFGDGTTSGISYDDLDDLPTLGTAAAADIGTGSTQVAAGDHTHAQLHDRSHAITSTSDHTATAWRVFYSDASGVQELALGNAGQALISNGASAAPSWGSAGSNSASDLSTGTLNDSRLSTNAQAAINLYLWSSFR